MSTRKFNFFHFFIYQVAICHRLYYKLSKHVDIKIFDILFHQGQPCIRHVCFYLIIFLFAYGILTA